MYRSLSSGAVNLVTHRTTNRLTRSFEFWSGRASNFFVVDGRLSEGKYVEGSRAGFVYIVPLFGPSIGRGSVVHVIRGWVAFGEVFLFLLPTSSF